MRESRERALAFRQRRGLLDVIKARGGRTERAYVEALQRAPWVVDALAALAKGKRPVS